MLIIVIDEALLQEMAGVAKENEKDFNAMLHNSKDMPKVQTITDEKSIKNTAEIGDTNVITEIIFSDYYRTFLLCILSIGVVFFMRNASIRKKVLALAGYEFIVFILFLWIFIVCIIFTEFDHESIIAILQWELKWILYFTISMISQFAMYYFFWKKSKILKIATLLFSLIIVIVPLYVFDFK